MRLRRLAVALAACCLQVRPAAADESINIFVAAILGTKRSRESSARSSTRGRPRTASCARSATRSTAAATRRSNRATTPGRTVTVNTYH